MDISDEFAVSGLPVKTVILISIIGEDHHSRVMNAKSLKISEVKHLLNRVIKPLYEKEL